MAHQCLGLWSLLVFLSLFGVFTRSNGLKVLVYPNDVHNNAQFKSLVMVAETLAEKHDVTLLINNLVVLGSHSKNITVIKYTCPGGVALPEPGKDFLKPVVTSSLFKLVGTAHLHAMLDICEGLLKRQYLMIQLQLNEFDVIFADITNICARVLIDFLQIPTVVWCYDNYDISCDFSNDFTIMAGSQDIATRFMHAFKYIMHTKLYQSSFIFEPFDKLQHQYNYNRGLSVSGVFSRNKPLVILNADFSVDLPRPLMPFVIPIAGLAINKNNDLPNDIDAFIANAGVDGFIFVELALKESLFFQKQLYKILNALRKSDKYVIVEDGIHVDVNFQGRLKSVSSNFHGAILSHKKLALFITSCLDNTIHDVVYNNLPVIYISSFGDADYCSSLFERHEIGMVLNILELSSLDIEKRINSFVNAARYEKNMGKLSSMFKHQVNNSKDRLWHWINFVSLHKGADNLHNSSLLQRKWYQYGMLDLILLVLCGSIVLLLLLFTVLSWIMKWVVNTFLWPRQVKYKEN